MALPRRGLRAQSPRLPFGRRDVDALIVFVDKGQHLLALTNQAQPADAAVLVHLTPGAPRRVQNITLLTADDGSSSCLVWPNFVPPDIVSHGLRPHERAAGLGQQLRRQRGWPRARLEGVFHWLEP